MLARDFGAVWSAPTTEVRLKKRIVRTLIHEAVANIDDSAAEIVLTLHWVGGTHTQHACHVVGVGNNQHRRHRRGRLSLALISRDDVIAGVLNRDGLKSVTAIAGRESASPRYDELPHTRSPGSIRGKDLWLNLSQAAAVVGVALRTLRLAAERGDVKAIHPLPTAPGFSVAST